MNVTKVELTVAQSLFGRCFFEGDIFYISDTYSTSDNSRDRCDVFNKEGELQGIIYGWYFDFGNKKVFKKIE
tara:strand:- start:30745 stop:30960 length:216 start_codon:yes stop_codon:yes gene_type:complete